MGFFDRFIKNNTNKNDLSTLNQSIQVNQKKENVDKYDNGSDYGSPTHQLGLVGNSKYVYECRIKNYEKKQKGCVHVHASDFGEVRWCMAGFLGCSLVNEDTSMSHVKHFVMPDDLGGKKLVVIAIRL